MLEETKTEHFIVQLNLIFNLLLQMHPTLLQGSMEHTSKVKKKK